jgi:hypothetical protein
LARGGLTDWGARRAIVDAGRIGSAFPTPGVPVPQSTSATFPGKMPISRWLTILDGGSRISLGGLIISPL